MDMHIERTMLASAAQVWVIVGEEFGDLSWSERISESWLEGELGEGAVRVCKFPPNQFSKTGEVREKLLSYSPEKRSLSYRAMGLSGVLRSATNRWTIIEDGPNQCLLRMHASVVLSFPFSLAASVMKPMMRRMGERTLDQLAIRVAERAAHAA